MKKILLGSLIVASSLFANDVLAVVNGEKITKSEINNLLKSKGITYDKIPVQYRQRVLDDIISQVILIQKAEKSGIENSPEFKKELNKLKKQLALKVFLNKKLDEIFVIEKEAKEFYNKNKDFMFKKPAEVKARHILVKTKEEAEKIIQQLKNTPHSELESKFIELAKKYSIGPSGKIGGELGWFSKDKMIPAFSNAAFNLEKGTFTLQPVHTRFGWHIIYVEDKKNNSYVPFEKVKPFIIKQLKLKKLSEYIKNLKQQSDIQYYN